MLRALNGFLVSLRFPWTISSECMWWILPLHKWIEWLFTALYKLKLWKTATGNVCRITEKCWDGATQTCSWKWRTLPSEIAESATKSLAVAGVGGAVSLSPDWTSFPWRLWEWTKGIHPQESKGETWIWRQALWSRGLWVQYVSQENIIQCQPVSHALRPLHRSHQEAGCSGPLHGVVGTFDLCVYCCFIFILIDVSIC